MGILDNVDQWFSLPPAMDQFVRQQVEYGCFGSKTDYWKFIIRELMLGRQVRAFTKNDVRKR